VSDLSTITARTFTYREYDSNTQDQRKINSEFSSKNNVTYRATHDSLHAEIIIKLIKLSTSKEHNVRHGEEESAG
jgi:hypothetical protein